MSQLTADKSRRYKLDPHVNADQPVDAGATIFMNSMVGQNSTTGLARQLVAGDAFLGFANAQAVNVANANMPGLAYDGLLVGAAGSVNVECRAKGVLVVPLAAIAGATGATNIGADVYASDGDTLTLTSTNNSKVGKVRNYLLTTGDVEVSFDTAGERTV